MKYRPDIDGLRAIAVLAVVLFHADLGFYGGFVGVDVFFVISGYLIFSIIYGEARQEAFSILSFFERRVRRIFPALIVLTAAVLACGWFLLLPPAYTALADSAVAVMTVWANVFFWQSTQGYFTPSIRELPLLHAWSLSLEEQFYILVPLGLMAATFWHRLLHPIAMGWLLGLLGAISFVASAVAVQLYPGAAFFFLPSRAWEFLLGCLLALVPQKSIAVGRPTAETMGFVGLALILVPCFTYTKATLFPAVAALPPCLGTALIILSCGPLQPCSAQNRTAQATFLAGILSSRPLVFVGLVSYSWYLWHWPTLAFAHYWLYDGLTLGWRLVLVGLSFFAAVLSWRFVEQPIRRGHILYTRSSLFLAALGALIAVLIACMFVKLTDGYPTRLPDRALAYAASENDRPPHYHIKAEEICPEKLPRFGRQDSPTSLLLWGDSQGYCLLPAFDELAKRIGAAGMAVTHGARAPVVGGQAGGPFGEGDDLPRWGDEVVAFVAKSGIKHTFLAGFWQDYTKPESRDRFVKSMISTIQALNTAGSKVWIINQIPSHQMSTPRDVVRSEIFGHFGIDGNPVTPGYEQQKEVLHSIATRCEGCDVVFLDPSALFYDDKTKSYRVEKNGRALYYDTIHVTKTTSRELIAPWLHSQVSKILGKHRR